MEHKRTISPRERKLLDYRKAETHTRIKRDPKQDTRTRKVDRALALELQSRYQCSVSM